MRLALGLLFCLSVWASESSAKIRILTFHYNRPDFIALQDAALKLFMHDAYELIVFNDAKVPEHAHTILETCDKLGIKHVRYEPSWHETNPLNQVLMGYLNDPTARSHLDFKNSTFSDVYSQPSVRHCHVIQYALDHYGYNHDDIVVIMDGDLFAIRPVDIRALMGDSQMIGAYKYIAEQDVGYFWVPFIAINMPTMPNRQDLRFHTDLIAQYIFDSGAHSHHYLRQNPTVKTTTFSWHSSSSHHYQSSSELLALGFTPSESKLIQDLPWSQSVEFHIDKHFLHFAGSSFDLEGNDVKSDHVTDFLESLISSALHKTE